MGVWCDKNGVVTSPCTGRYSNDASGGDAAIELTFEKKPMTMSRKLPNSSSSSVFEEKKRKDDKEPGGLLSSFAHEKKTKK